MVLWNGLGQASTLAQLAGVDAGELISMIIQAVETVHRNREECRQLVHHVKMMGDLLQLLQQSEMMPRPEIRKPLDGLEDTLRQAYVLVTSCQQSNIMYRFFMAWNQAQKFRDVRDRIDSYLWIYPLISHIDTRYFLSGLYGRAHTSVSIQPQGSEKEQESFTGHASPNYRTQGSASDDNGIESVQVRTVPETFAVEQKHNGCENAQVLPKRRHRFRWLVQWAQRDTSTPEPILGLIGPEQTVGFTFFKFSQLAASTNSFSSNNMIGRGGYSTVYKGVLPDGVHIAIKICHGEHVSSQPGRLEFENEVQIIPKLQHANILKLLGCCIEGDNRILVYEYMPRGSLHFLIDELKAGVSLAWSKRFQIIEGIAQGAVYLHQHSRLRVVHGDLKPSNILLDCDMTPRIIDFGLAQVLSSDKNEKDTFRVAGTLYYLEPEFCRTAIISTKSDVYSFGVICLEIITAQHASFSPEGQSLVVYAWELWSSERATEVIDASLRVKPGISKILRCIQIALLCVQENRADRPTMSDILMFLKCDSMTLPVPRRPEDPCKLWASPARRPEDPCDSDSAGRTSYSSIGWMSEELEGR
ncbi:unnamed protein product [Urochloa decumbens]|uniref:Protein kinase domain-containing protein n=1 Tax=Urochloa decumbens TaxID=240449 RepID=A0ABC9B3A2_9POAL